MPKCAVCDSMARAGSPYRSSLPETLIAMGHLDAQIQPTADLLAGRADQPCADIDDHAALLRRLNEAHGGDLAEFRVVPSRQRLDA